jgi:hypothetical protein
VTAVTESLLCGETANTQAQLSHVHCL